MIFSLALVVVCWLGPALTEAACGQRPGGTRIVNGQEAVPHSWPWQLSLQLYGMHNCGASLISPGWALTAAHCVGRSNEPWLYGLKAGSHKRQDDGVLLRISEIIVHEGYSRSHLRHDVALLKLASPVTMNSKINTICLPKQGDMARPGGNCFISGWGRISPTDLKKMADKLQQSKVPVVDYQTCRRINGGKIDQNAMICIGGSGSSACSGDSGGPLVCEENGRWVLRGASSWVTDRSCPGDTYSVYARVSSYINWINQKTGSGSGAGGGQDCKDIYKNCSSYRKYCSHSRIKRNCKKTCNNCS